MNKPLYAKSRVVHDAIQRRYTVEYKKGFFSLKWEKDSHYDYYEKEPAYGVVHNQSQAFELAKNRADQLMNKSVVYENKPSYY